MLLLLGLAIKVNRKQMVLQALNSGLDIVIRSLCALLMLISDVTVGNLVGTCVIKQGSGDIFDPWWLNFCQPPISVKSLFKDDRWVKLMYCKSTNKNDDMLMHSNLSRNFHGW